MPPMLKDLAEKTGAVEKTISRILKNRLVLPGLEAAMASSEVHNALTLEIPLWWSESGY